jgi:hypothetical protein
MVVAAADYWSGLPDWKNQTSEPPPTVFVDAIDAVFDATIQYDRRFFESLDRMIQREP